MDHFLFDLLRWTWELMERAGQIGARNSETDNSTRTYLSLVSSLLDGVLICHSSLCKLCVSLCLCGSKLCKNLLPQRHREHKDRTEKSNSDTALCSGGAIVYSYPLIIGCRAPEERYVSGRTYMALLRSANLLEISSYKHVAPLER